MRMRPPELMQAPRAPGWEEDLSRGTRLKPSQVPSTSPQRLSLMLAPPPVRVICTFVGASTRCSTGSLALQVPLLFVSWQMIQPQSQSRLPVALVQPLVLLGIFCMAILPPRLMASDRASIRLDRRDSVALRTRQVSISTMKDGPARAIRMAMMLTATISSMAVNPLIWCRVGIEGVVWLCIKECLQKFRTGRQRLVSSGRCVHSLRCRAEWRCCPCQTCPQDGTKDSWLSMRRHWFRTASPNDL